MNIEEVSKLIGLPEGMDLHSLDGALFSRCVQVKAHVGTPSLSTTVDLKQFGLVKDSEQYQELMRQWAEGSQISLLPKDVRDTLASQANKVRAVFAKNSRYVVDYTQEGLYGRDAPRFVLFSMFPQAIEQWEKRVQELNETVDQIIPNLPAYRDRLEKLLYSMYETANKAVQERIVEDLAKGIETKAAIIPENVQKVVVDRILNKIPRPEDLKAAYYSRIIPLWKPSNGDDHFVNALDDAISNAEEYLTQEERDEVALRARKEALYRVKGEVVQQVKEQASGIVEGLIGQVYGLAETTAKRILDQLESNEPVRGKQVASLNTMVESVEALVSHAKGAIGLNDTVLMKGLDEVKRVLGIASKNRTREDYERALSPLYDHAHAVCLASGIVERKVIDVEEESFEPSVTLVNRTPINISQEGEKMNYSSSQFSALQLF